MGLANYIEKTQLWNLSLTSYHKNLSMPELKAVLDIPLQILFLSKKTTLPPSPPKLKTPQLYIFFHYVASDFKLKLYLLIFKKFV